MQRLEYASIPNTKPIAYVQTLVSLFAEIRRGKTLKELKEYMRMRNIYEKERFPVLMDFLDIRLSPTVQFGKFGEAILAAEDEPAARRVIAERLLSQNLLLAKYCLEAMDQEKGGRLHSTRELYKMITSFVYPGKEPSWPNFQSWVDWAEAANLIRVIGIRWGLGPVAADFMQRLRAIDPDEFLEEEKEEELLAQQAQEQTAQEQPQVQTADAGKPTGMAQEEAVSVEPRQTEPVAETGKPGLEAPGPSVAAKGPVPTETAPAPGREVLVEVPQQKTPVRVVTLESVPWEGTEFFVPATPQPQDLETSAEKIKAWYEGFVGKADWGLKTLGISSELGLPGLLPRAAWVALVLARGIAPETVGAVYRALDEAGAFDGAQKGRLTFRHSLYTRLSPRDAAALRALETTVHLPRLFRASQGFEASLELSDPAAFLCDVGHVFFEGLSALAPFYFARVLHLAGKLSAPLTRASFVPTHQARLNAFRVGFLDQICFHDIGSMADHAVRLAGLFGPPKFEAPLAQMHIGFGCSFHCAKVASCPLACREKGEVTRLDYV